MKNTLILAMLLSLGACATLDNEPTALIPIAVTCKTENPNEPSLRYVPPYGTVFEAVRDLLGDRELMSAYQVQLKAALLSCK